jgi:hypothetical protein
VASPLAGKGQFVALPNTVERIIKESSEGIDENLLPTYFKRAKERLDELVRPGDPYSQPQPSIVAAVPLTSTNSKQSHCSRPNHARDGGISNRT